MKNNAEPTDNLELKHLQLFLYLIPIFGFFPSLWTLYHDSAASHEQLKVSRLSVTLAGSWMVGYLLLGMGAENLDFLSLRLLMLNTFFTSGYFLVSTMLMIRLYQHKPIRLPGFSKLANQINRSLAPTDRKNR